MKNHQRVDNSRGCRVCTALTRRLKKAGPFDSRRWDDGPRSLGGRGFGWWDEGGGEFGWTEIFWCPDFGHLKDSFLPEIKQQKVPWKVGNMPKLVVGFKDFLFSPVPGEMIQLDWYFSNGLVQPPTRRSGHISHQKSFQPYRWPLSFPFKSCQWKCQAEKNPSYLGHAVTFSNWKIHCDWCYTPVI